MQNEGCRKRSSSGSLHFSEDDLSLGIYPSRAESLENSCPLAFSN